MVLQTETLTGLQTAILREYLHWASRLDWHSVILKEMRSDSCSAFLRSANQMGWLTGCRMG